jgi:DNA-binding response OmpR family regulator
LATGFSEAIDAEQASAMGIRKFVMKPIIARDLAAAVRSLLHEEQPQEIATQQISPHTAPPHET